MYLILCSDTSHTHAGSAVWQMQDGKRCLLGYANRTLPPACANYSITELEMFSLLVNIYSWQHLVHETEFDIAMDHQALVYIMKHKIAPGTKRVARFLEKLSGYAFNLYYMKGKDLILSDFLSCIDSDKTDPNVLIPISFMGRSHLQEDECHIGTRSCTKQAGLQLPKVHDHDKSLDQHNKPKHQPAPTPQMTAQISPTQAKPRQAHSIQVSCKPTAAQIVCRKTDREKHWYSK